MKEFIVLIFCLINLSSFSQQNLNIDFRPLKSEGLLPEIFTKSVKETVESEINDLIKTEDTTSKIKSDLFIVSNYSIDWEIKSGNTLINDEVTEYVNNIVDVILKTQPDLRKKIKVYTSKSPVVNASAYYNGTVFIDLGLIAHAKNEAQIAYVLCHEIAHFLKQHSFEELIHAEQLESTAEGKSNEVVFKEKCNYSKEQESEADSIGFNLFRATNYDVNQAVSVFDVLQHSDLPFELAEFKKSFFETDNFILPEKYLLKSLAAIKDNSYEDDSESTHPNTGKRKEAIKKLIDPQSKGVEYNVGEVRFNYVRELARFEICRLLLRYRDYNAALYSAYILAEKYPENIFLIRTISKCLYAISLYNKGFLRYNKDSYLDGPIHYLEITSYPQQLYFLINKMSEKEWNIMSLNYVFRKHKKFPEDKTLSALSDSLLQTMYYVNAQFEMPQNDNTIFSNVNSNIDTTSWYKSVFIDLFSTDQEFKEKFPKTIGHDFVMPYTPKSYHVNRFSQKMRTVENIGIVMCLKPQYVIFDDDELQSRLQEAETGQKNLLESINNCASKQNFQLVILDPGMIESKEVTKINDYSVITDWLKECSDGSDNEKSTVPIFNTDELQEVVQRYGTSHVLKTGFAVLNGKKKEYVFYSVVYDLKKNKKVYIKQELFKGRPSQNDMQDKICSLFNELKFGK